MKYEIDYSDSTELPNKALRFKIRDEKNVLVGYAVTSAVDSFAILGTTLNQNTESNDFRALKNDLGKFCEVYYHEASDKTTES